MSLIPEEFHPFSHTGIVAVEQGEAVVYEARGSYKMGPGTPASDWFQDRPGIRRLAIADYLQREKYAVVYAPPPDVDTARVATFARHHHQAGTPFDPYFDDRTKDELYCAELVHAALSAGGWQGVAPVPNRANPSLSTVLQWWGIRDHGTLPSGLLVIESRYVGELGDAPDRAEALIFNAFKAEIHRRFTPDQKLGNIFRFSGDLKFRAPVSRLLKQARRAMRGDESSLTFEIARERLRSLAVEMFGPAN